MGDRRLQPRNPVALPALPRVLSTRQSPKGGDAMIRKSDLERTRRDVESNQARADAQTLSRFRTQPGYLVKFIHGWLSEAWELKRDAEAGCVLDQVVAFRLHDLRDRARKLQLWCDTELKIDPTAILEFSECPSRLFRGSDQAEELREFYRLNNRAFLLVTRIENLAVISTHSIVQDDQRMSAKELAAAFGLELAARVQTALTRQRRKLLEWRLR